MSFVAEFDALPFDALLRRAQTASEDAVRESMAGLGVSIAAFPPLNFPAGSEILEPLCRPSQGFRNILLVAGEHPKFVSNNYLTDCVRALHDEIPSISLEVGPMEAEDYRPIVQAGADGLVVYQETYDRAVYAEMHTSGPKRNFDWRLETPERAYAAGFRRLGIGALYGLGDWRAGAISVAAHAGCLLRNCWKAQFTLSLPRL